MNKKLNPLLSIILFLSTGFSAFAQKITVPDSQFKSLVEEMIENNPSLESYRYHADIQKSLVSVESSWSDPKLVLGMKNLPVDTWKLNQEAMTGMWLTVSQNIPITGKNNYQGENAQILAEVRELALDAESLQLTEKLADAWYDLNFNIEAADRLERIIQNYKELIMVVRTQYQNGQKRQSALFRLETAKSKLRERRLDYILKIEQAESKVSFLLGKTFEGVTAGGPELISDFSELDEDDLSKEMLLMNPLIAISKEKLQAAEVRGKIAQASWWPDINLSASYGYRQDSENGMARPDFFSLTAGLSLPVFGAKKQAKVVESSISRVKMAEADFRQTKLLLRNILQNGIDEDMKLSGQLNIYNEEIIPQSQNALTAVIREFTSGFTNVNAVILSQNAVIEAELTRLSKISERRKLRVHIMSITGLNEYDSASKHSDRRSDRDE